MPSMRKAFIREVEKSIEMCVGSLGLESLLLFVYHNLLSSGSIYRLEGWRAAERFFAEFFGFLFDNTSPCYLVFASLFLYSYALILLFVVHVYALE